MMFPKPTKVKDKKYGRWLAENKVCFHCGRGGYPPHHLWNPEGGRRRNRDDRQIEICFDLHRFYHDHPEEERKVEPMLEKIAKECWDEYQRTI